MNARKTPSQRARQPFNFLALGSVNNAVTSGQAGRGRRLPSATSKQQTRLESDDDQVRPPVPDELKTSAATGDFSV